METAPTFKSNSHSERLKKSASMYFNFFWKFFGYEVIFALQVVAASSRYKLSLQVVDIVASGRCKL